MKYNFEKIHIGKLISEIVSVRNFDEYRIETFFKNTDIKIEDVYNSESIDTHYLLKWSKLLKFDFFRVYSQHLSLFSSIRPLEKVTNKNLHSSIPTFKKNLYTKEIINFICDLIKNNKMTVNQVIKEYNIPKTTIYRWIKKYNL